MLIKRAVLMLMLFPYLVKTDKMIADMFTKALDKGSFTKFRDVVMNSHLPLRDRHMLLRSEHTRRAWCVESASAQLLTQSADRLAEPIDAARSLAE